MDTATIIIFFGLVILWQLRGMEKRLSAQALAIYKLSHPEQAIEWDRDARALKEFGEREKHRRSAARKEWWSRWRRAEASSALL